MVLAAVLVVTPVICTWSPSTSPWAAVQPTTMGVALLAALTVQPNAPTAAWTREVSIVIGTAAKQLKASSENSANRAVFVN